MSRQVMPIAELDERYRALRLERPSEVTRLKSSIERRGLLHALVVNQERDGAVSVLDGFKRLTALRALEHVEVHVDKLQLDDAGARAALLAYNAPSRGLCDLEEAWIVRALVRDVGLRQVDVAKL